MSKLSVGTRAVLPCRVCAETLGPTPHEVVRGSAGGRTFFCCLVCGSIQNVPDSKIGLPKV